MIEAGSRADLAELISALVAIDSVNPTLVAGGAGEAEIARFVAGWLERNRLEVEVRELAPRRTNVIARARGRGGGRTLMLNAHLDTVGLGGFADGLEPRVDGDRLYGRGAYDMKASLAATMLVTAAAAVRGLAGDVVLTAVADEEAESIGSAAVADEVAADAAIVTEPTELRVAIAHKGFVWLEVETHGRAAHGSRYDLGVDAIARMGPVLVALASHDERLRGERTHPLLGGPSLHASLIEGGQELSSYPEHCLLKVERRTLPGETADMVEDEMRALAGGASVRRLLARPPLQTPPDAPIVATLLSQAATVIGREPEVIGVPYWTDAALLAEAGIPTVVFGPGGEGAHADVEWVELTDVERVIAALLATVDAFCADAA